MLFYVLLLWRLSVALAAPALDEDGCDSPFAAPTAFRKRPVRSRLSNCAAQPLKRT